MTRHGLAASAAFALTLLLSAQGAARACARPGAQAEGATTKVFRNWALTARGLAVTFEPYRVGAFAAGAPGVLIPYAEPKQAVRPDGPLASLVR